MEKKIIYEKNGCRLYGVVTTEVSRQRVGVRIYEVNARDQMSDSLDFKRSEVIASSSKLNQILDFEICLTEKELALVINECQKLVNGKNSFENVDERWTLKEVYKAFCEYARRKNAKEICLTDDIVMVPAVVVTENFLNIRTTEFENVMTEIPETEGYEKLDILKAFKMMDVLETDKGRAYDKKVSMNRKKINCYRIEIIDIKENEESSKKEKKNEK